MIKTNFPQLERPPITEAIFEVLFSLEEGFDIILFEKFYQTVSSEYVQKKDLTFFEGKIDPKDITSNSLKSEVIGYLLLNEDKSKAIQLRKNGFAFSINKNSYKSWDLFKEEAFLIFNKLKDLYKIKLITRTSLRYINLINLPTKIGDIKEYILITPNTPNSLPLSKMFIQVTIPNEKIGGIGIVTQNFNIGFESEETFTYILDIDVQILKNYEIEDTQIHEDFEKLREFKNHIFFHSISDKTINIL